MSCEINQPESWELHWQYIAKTEKGLSETCMMNFGGHGTVFHHVIIYVRCLLFAAQLKYDP